MPPARKRNHHAASDLGAYAEKRDFAVTPEPAPGDGRAATAAGGRGYVVQRHAARRLHYDLRLEIGGTLKSWAVTRGPSLDPAERRLAVRTEDHPLTYAAFEGTIPAGNYGAGTVMIWDRGTWHGATEAEADAALAAGHLKFQLDGERMRGGWSLTRIETGRQESWLLVKERDRFASRGEALEDRYERSVTTGRTMEEITKGAKPRKKPEIHLPEFVPPMLCATSSIVPDDAAHIFEMKYDGYRVQLAKAGASVALRTRTGLDWSDRFPRIKAAAREIPTDRLSVDGEIVVFDAAGVSDFAALAERIGAGLDEGLVYVAFDILAMGKRDVRRLPLTERKHLLDKALGALEPAGLIRKAPYVRRDGRELLGRVGAAGGEGIIVKEAASPYRSGRSEAWTKIKIVNQIDAVVVGYMPSTRHRPFASLLVAIEGKGGLVYAGGVGSGYAEAAAEELATALRARARQGPSPSLRGSESAPSRARWVEPTLTAVVRYNNLTPAGILRGARFLGLRRDQEPPVEQPARSPVSTPEKPVALTSPTRIVFPDRGLTKADVAGHYEQVAQRMLPHLAGRPVSVIRAPDGIAGETFFQRHPMPAMKAGIDRMPDPEGTHRDYMIVRGEAGLRTVVQFGGIELHGWGSCASAIDHPDRMVFDLDPSEEVGFTGAREAARLLRDILASAGLASFAMVTGGKGVHVVVPLDRSQDWGRVEGFASGLARRLSRLEPNRFVATLSKSRRHGKIFIDWLRNKRSATSVLPYSLRARQGAPVATPVTWERLARIESATEFSLGSVPTPEKDPWAGFFEIAQHIAPAVDALVG